MTTATEHNPNEARLKELLLGRKIVHVEKQSPTDGEYTPGLVGVLTLDDGTTLRVGGNDGGCSCGAGDYSLETLNTVDNAIANIIVEERPDQEERCEICDKYSCEHNGFYRIFVIAEDHNQHLVAQFDGSDGNGYYGTGWWLTVVPQPKAVA